MSITFHGEGRDITVTLGGRGYVACVGLAAGFNSCGRTGS